MHRAQGLRGARFADDSITPSASDPAIVVPRQPLVQGSDTEATISAPVHVEEVAVLGTSRQVWNHLAEPGKLCVHSREHLPEVHKLCSAHNLRRFRKPAEKGGRSRRSVRRWSLPVDCASVLRMKGRPRRVALRVLVVYEISLPTRGQALLQVVRQKVLLSRHHARPE